MDDYKKRRPTDMWKDFLMESHSQSNAVSAAFELYVDKYAKPKPGGPVPSEKYDTGRFVPGKIYAFSYITQDKPSKERPVINRRPVILSMGQFIENGKMKETGIDLMLVPPVIRLAILDTLYHHYGKDINENEELSRVGKRGIKALNLNYKIASKMFSVFGWQQAYCAFSSDNIKNVSVVDYSEWGPFSVLYTKGIEGKQVKRIYDEYIKGLTRTYQKMDPYDPKNKTN